MAALTRSDLESAFGFLAEAETAGGRDPFPAELLATFAALIPCDFVSYTELDLANQSFIASVSVPAVADPTGAGAYWRVMDKHPLRGAQGSAAKLSDFVSVRQLHGLQVYTDYLRLWDVEHQLVVRVSSTPEVRRTFLFERSRGDFSERDRLLLDLLRPHLVRLQMAARTRRLVAALASGSDAAGLAWLVLGPQNEVEFATERTWSLLAAFFGGRRRATLPEPVGTWLRQHATGRAAGGLPTQTSEPLAVESDGRRLVIHRIGPSLLLANETSAMDGRLTRREHEILALVRTGMSNAEIASALSLARGTVRRHLQNVYAKLGVRSRTAAIARTDPPRLF